MRFESGFWGRKTRKVLKFAWYLCASILILSLPTFSFLVPRVDLSRVGEKSPPESVQSARKGSEAASPRPVWGNGRAVSVEEAGTPSSAAARPAREAGQVEIDRAEEPSPRMGGAVVSADEFISPRRFQRRRVESPEPLRGSDPEAVQAGPLLNDLQEGYEQAFTNLFPDVFFGVPASGNPFQDALDDNETTGGNSPTDDGPSPGQGDGSGSDGGGDPPPPEPGPPDDPPPPEPGSGGGSGDGTPPRSEPEYGFLIVGEAPGNPDGSLIARANLDVSGQFVLENRHRFGFFSGVLHSLLTFGEHESVLAADFDDNGLNDFVVATEAAAVGTGIESYLQTAPGRFELHGSAFLYLQAVQSMALFDFNDDGKQELALALFGQPNLFVFELAGAEWVYLTELALPVRPAALMTTSTVAGPRNRTLFVLDDNLQYVVSATQRRPDVFRFGSTAPLNRLSRWSINWTGRPGSGDEIMAFAFADQIVLAERRRGSLRTFVGMDIGRKAQLMIIGDFAGIGSRQIVWVP